MANPAEIKINALVKNTVHNTNSETLDTNGDVPLNVGNSSNGLILIFANNSTTVKMMITIKAGNSRAALTAKELQFELAVRNQAGASKILANLESARFLNTDGSFTINVQAASGAPNVGVTCYRGQFINR
jgi:hypothetical protein